MTLSAPCLILILSLITADTPTQATVPAPAQPPTQTSTRLEAPLPPEVPVPAGINAWHMTLPEAIRLSLGNSPIVHVVSTGTRGVLPAGYTAPSLLSDAVTPGLSTPGNGGTPTATVGPNDADIVVARLGPDASVWKFRSDLMAHLRSVEQQYWALSAQQINLWSRETAVRLGTEILKRERAELEHGRATTADVAEAEQQLENFKLNLITANSDLVTTERQLRNILGVPASENRRIVSDRIVSDTVPTEAKVDPDWETIVKLMIASHPDVLLHRELLAGAAIKESFGQQGPGDDQRLKNQKDREHQQDLYRQTIHETTHSLARFFLEVDANYKQFQTAGRLMTAARLRLEAQQAFADEGRITVDRLLDAVSQYSNSVAQEAQYKAGYNTSMASLEEAKGTLLTYEGVTVTAEPAPKKSVTVAYTTPASDANAKPSSSTTYKVRASVAGLKLIEVEVEVAKPADSPL